MKQDIALLRMLDSSYKWCWKTINCVMVSREKPVLAYGCYNAPERVELGGFTPTFDALIMQDEPILIETYINKEAEMTQIKEFAEQ